MAKKSFWLGMLVMVLAFGFIFSGCATNLSTTKSTNFNRRTMGIIGVPNYTVLGPVILEKNWFGILGFSTPFIGPLAGIDLYVYQRGGITYADLLNEARRLYPDADAVIDIGVDFSKKYYFIFYGSRRNIFSGIAIKYSRDEVTHTQQSTGRSN